MLIQCLKTVDGITAKRFYEFKWYASNGDVIIVNNRFQLLAYPVEYFNFFNNNNSKEVMRDRLRAMLKSKTFFTV